MELTRAIERALDATLQAPGASSLTSPRPDR
jgi:hypothetical protein